MFHFPIPASSCKIQLQLNQMDDWTCELVHFSFQVIALLAHLSWCGLASDSFFLWTIILLNHSHFFRRALITLSFSSTSLPPLLIITFKTFKRLNVILTKFIFAVIISSALLLLVDWEIFLPSVFKEYYYHNMFCRSGQDLQRIFAPSLLLSSPLLPFPVAGMTFGWWWVQWTSWWAWCSPWWASWCGPWCRNPLFPASHCQWPFPAPIDLTTLGFWPLFESEDGVDQWRSANIR